MFELDPRKQLACYGFPGGSGPVWDPSGLRNGGISTRARRLCGNREDCQREKTRLQKAAVKALKKKHVFLYNWKKKKILGHCESLLSGGRF